MMKRGHASHEGGLSRRTNAAAEARCSGSSSLYGYRDGGAGERYLLERELRVSDYLPD